MDKPFENEAQTKTTQVHILPSLGYRSYVLAVLTLCAATSTLDRQILTMLVEPIRKELGLSDAQIGMLTGIAFALIYVVSCIPLARLADRTSRRAVIAASVTFWSVMTVACGLAQSFWQLFLARMGVGFGESGNSAPTHAVIADIFPQRQRGTVMSLYLLGAPIGMGAGLMFGGWALHEYGWRWAFILAGVPGMILGPLVWLTVRDIRKGMADGVTEVVDQPSLAETLRTLWAIRTLPLLMAGSTFSALVGMGMAGWFPAFLSRSHGLSNIEIGTKLGFAMALGSVIGHLCGGPLADWLGRRDMRAQVWLPIFTSLGSSALAAAAFMVPPDFVFPLIGLQVMVSGLFAAPMIAITTTLAPVYARATAAACLTFAINLIGLGIGPAVVGTISDILRPAYGEESLRMAMLLTLLIAPLAAYLFYLASRHYREDLATAHARLGSSVAAVSMGH